MALPLPSFRYDPADVTALRRQVGSLPGAARLREITIRQILVSADALRELPQIVTGYAPARMLMVMDPTPMRRGQEDLKLLVAHLMVETGLPLEILTLRPDPDGEVHASVANALTVREAIQPGTLVISVGSGSITDTVKHGCFLFDQSRPGEAPVPLVAVQTANTVTAFTSNLAVLLKDGVKRTVPSRFPDVLVCDLQVLADAPLPMTRAGAGDMTAKFVCYGDWYLGSVLGMAPTYSEAPLELWEDIDRLLLPYAGEIGVGTPVGTLVLTKLLLLSGMGMSIVGETTPLSGYEHVISHVLDMSAEHEGRRMPLHGAQVGVIAIRAAAAWQLLLAEFDPRTAPRQIPVPAADHMEQVVLSTFAQIDASGAMGAECWSDYRQKLAEWSRQQAAWESFLANWESRIKPRLNELVRTPEEIAAMLAAVGAPLRFEDLEPPVATEQAMGAFLSAPLIRKRFSVGDLLYWLGWLDRDFAERAFALADRAVREVSAGPRITARAGLRPTP